MSFAPPHRARPLPPPGVRDLGDICDNGKWLDALWTPGKDQVALELKYQRARNWRGTFADGRTIDRDGWADDAGYKFLKDVHRLERLIAVESRDNRHAVTPTHRFALLLSNEPYDFEGRGIHDGFCLRQRTLERGHRVGYNETKPNGEPTSVNTLWGRKYRPFLLAGSYAIRWEDLRDDVSRFKPAVGTAVPFPSSRLLLLEVEAQPNATREAVPCVPG